MAGKMYKSGGGGSSVESLDVIPRKSLAELEKEKKDIENQKRLSEYRRYQKEKEKFFKAIGETLNSNSENFYYFHSEYRKGKKWREIAESILGERVDISFISEGADPKRGKGIQARLMNWYEKDENMKK